MSGLSEAAAGPTQGSAGLGWAGLGEGERVPPGLSQLLRCSFGRWRRVSAVPDLGASGALARLGLTPLKAFLPVLGGTEPPCAHKAGLEGKVSRMGWAPAA